MIRAEIIFRSRRPWARKLTHTTPPGVDIELPAMKRRLDLRRRVLTPRECDSLGGVAGLTEQEEVLLRFSVKEAVYKAAHPYLHRPLGFKDVSFFPAECNTGPCAVINPQPLLVAGCRPR